MIILILLSKNIEKIFSFFMKNFIINRAYINQSYLSFIGHKIEKIFFKINVINPNIVLKNIKIRCKEALLGQKSLNFVNLSNYLFFCSFEICMFMKNLF